VSTIINLLSQHTNEQDQAVRTHALRRVEWIVDWARRLGPERGILKLTHYNALMHQYGVHGMWDKLMVAFRYIRASPVMEPDAVTYSSLIKVPSIHTAPAVVLVLLPTHAQLMHHVPSALALSTHATGRQRAFVWACFEESLR
jgi:pentatricopeptide repeat protein